jgi:hypothetical protein
MNNYVWKILSIDAENEVIITAKYHVTASTELGDTSVETEGNWYFTAKIDKPYAEITEQDVIDLIKEEAIKDSVNIIESRLNEQLAYIADNKVKAVAPWLPQTFTPSI